MAIINNIEFLIGCDPEVFVTNEKGEFVSAYGMIPGTKTEPLKVRNGMVQVDGMALEFGIDPAANKRDFVYRVNDVLTQLKEMLPEGHNLSISSIAQFSPEVMAAQPEEALELGCDPDYNAYTLDKNPRPNLPIPTIRSAGGHVHIGWGIGFPTTDPKHVEACAALAAEMDYYLGAASLAWDKDALRRSIYGAAGAFRPKPYGMEYRSGSNQWLKSDELIGFIYDTTITAVHSLVDTKERKGVKNQNFFKGAINLPSQEIINNNWTYLGEAIFKTLKAQYVQ
jgi:hypothetical protein